MAKPAPKVSSFFRILLATLLPVLFCLDFRVVSLISMKQLAGILIGLMLNLQIKLGRTDILTILSLPIHEHGIPLHQPSTLSF